MEEVRCYQNHNKIDITEPLFYLMRYYFNHSVEHHIFFIVFYNFF